MTPEHLRDLAAAGGVCAQCGGVHVTNADTAILTIAGGLPWCDCDCPTCRDYQTRLAALVSRLKEPPHDTP